MATGNIELLIMRHAQRTGPKIILHGGDGPGIKLTEKGVADAYDFGNRLKSRFPDYKFLIPSSSTKERTVQTAELIYKGYSGDPNKKVDVKIDLNLFPWMAVKYANLIARNLSEKYGDAAFFLTMYELKEKEIAFIAAPFANIVLNAINKAENQPESKEIQLFVSHDYDITAFAYYILPREELENYRKHPLPIPVLGGFRISIKGANPTFYWNEKEIRIDISRIVKLMEYYKEIQELAKKLRVEGKFDFNSSYFD